MAANSAEIEYTDPDLEEPNQGLSYLRERLAGFPIRELVLAGPRAARFIVRSTTRHLRNHEDGNPDIPTRMPSPGTAASVLIDEIMLAFMATTRLNHSEDELDRIAGETAEAIESMTASGIFADPAKLHPAPPPPDVKIVPNAYRGIRYDDVTFDSGYEPAIALPGTTRWQSVGPNRDARAFVLRHDDARPWLVNLHGFGMGNRTDLAAMRALHFHRDMRLNVIQPVFPLHGERSAGPEGEQTLTLDYLNNVHGVSQAVWDARRLMAWARTEHGATSFVVHGVSMGGYTAAILAGLVDDLDGVISGVPTVDMAWVMRRHTPEEERVALDERALLGPMADKIHAPVSPLSFAPKVPIDRRFIYAGVADRMATPGEAHRLWKHWEQPPVLWYRGAHVSFAWSREVRRFVDHAVQTSIATRGNQP